jgi:hypothetical protein
MLAAMLDDRVRRRQEATGQMRIAGNRREIAGAITRDAEQLADFRRMGAGRRAASARTLVKPIRDRRIGAHWTSDILEALLAQICKIDRDFAENLIVRRRRDADTTRFGDALKTGGDIDAIAKNVMGFDDYVADINANAKARRLSSASPIVRSWTRSWNFIAARTASTALRNSARSPSPVFFTTRPPYCAIDGSTASVRSMVKRACVASSSLCIRRE